MYFLRVEKSNMARIFKIGVFLKLGFYKIGALALISGNTLNVFIKIRVRRPEMLPRGGDAESKHPQNF